MVRSEQKLRFSHNRITAVNRTQGALSVNDFVLEMQEVMKKYRVQSIRGGVVGYHDDNTFGISEAEINLNDEWKVEEKI